MGKILPVWEAICPRLSLQGRVASEMREAGFLPDSKDGVEVAILRYRGNPARERRRVSGRKIEFGLTQRLFRAPWRWSGRNSWSPQRGGGRRYRPQFDYDLFGTVNQFPYQIYAIHKLMPIAYTRSAPQTHAIFLYVSIICPSLPASRFEKSCSPWKIRFRPSEEVSFPEKIVTVRYTWKATGRRKGAKKETPSYS